MWGYGFNADHIEVEQVFEDFRDGVVGLHLAVAILEEYYAEMYY